MNERFDTATEAQKLWDDYQNGLSYQANCGLSKNLPRFVKFYQGDQWPKATPATKNLPRPVVNIIKMICRNKKSAILSTPVRIVFRAEDTLADVEKFNRFADYIQKEIGQDALDKKAVGDGVVKGSYFYHYYWDAEAKGKDGVKEGGLRCETIDPLNIFFSNPTEVDEQKQKWIMIASREDVSSVRAKCDSDVDKESIVADENNSKYGTVEQEGNKLCTVLTRYFRRDGEVFCEKATKTTIVNKPFPLTPDLASAGVELGFFVEEDAPNNALPDATAKDQLIPDAAKMYLYPIVVGNYEYRESSIYGLGEVEGIIPNQKSINFNLAMALLNAQETAWGKYIVHPRALQGQVINNEPGQVLVDYSETGSGIRKMTEQAMQSQPLTLVDTLTQLTRAVTGSSEVMTGETIGANMSGAAIAQLQSQAQQPVEELRDTFWKVKEKQGLVLAQFFKHYYEQKSFSYMDSVTSENGKTEEVQLEDIFDSAEFRAVEFTVVTEATSGTKASAAGDINILDVMVSKGLISPKTYIKVYPDDAITNKSKLLKAIEEEENDQLRVMSAQYEQAIKKLAESAEIIQKQQKSVDQVQSIIEELMRTKAFLAQLYTEAKTKISQGNIEVARGNQALADTTHDAQEMAATIAAAANQGAVNLV
ncbi:MAG: hypothetical protein E7609_05320 [Ruminococcaceae bacterium]|nr:hypothetical protein [Oscillospiraceae bacterium]